MKPIYSLVPVIILLFIFSCTKDKTSTLSPAMPGSAFISTNYLLTDSIWTYDLFDSGRPRGDTSIYYNINHSIIIDMDSINGKLVIGKDTFLKNNDSYKYGGDPLTTISFTEDSVKINWYAWSGGAGHHSYTLHGHKN